MITPNPGSKEAIEQGCLCPVVDNHKGKGILQPDETILFWYTSNCPVHTMPMEIKKSDD